MSFILATALPMTGPVRGGVRSAMGISRMAVPTCACMLQPFSLTHHDLPRLRVHVLTLQHQQVKDEEMQRSVGGAIILERIKGRPALGVESNHFAVDDGFIRHRGQGLHYTWITGVEVIIV